MRTAAAIDESQHHPYGESREIMSKLEDELICEEALTAEHSEVEGLIEERTRELKRALLQAHLDMRAAKERAVEVRDADGGARAQVRESERKMETLFGEVTVTRKLYQAPGAQGLAPMDAALNLPEERFSHGVRRFVAEESAYRSFDEVVEQLKKRTGAEVGKRQVEELAVRAARDFDAFYAERTAVSETTSDLVVLSFDGKGIAMRREDLRAATRKAAESKERRLQTRLAPGEKAHRKRMATVAAVYTLAPWTRTAADVLHTLRDARTEDSRPKPVNKRVVASVAESAQQVIDEAFAEALRRDPERRRTWVVLVDGDREQLRRVQRSARKAGVQVRIVLDIVHVLEYLWRAAYAFHPPGTEAAQTWVRQRLFALLQGRTGGQVAKSIRQMAARRNLDKASAAAVHACARYLVSHSRFLRYERALALGLPIATGVIEGACRYLVQDRMGRTGARWSLEGAEAILRLRALLSNGDFDQYWPFHLAQERRRIHLDRYALGAPPDPLPPSRAPLSLVK
ncbi:ISKra4-like element ISHoc2 family transposase [Haliangium ochraceum]|uniref:ISKra4 family transposase n=1 Tax=Haliangium ochraceum (strain DSM 14365 / JCM 11303 / SMP-2) TaxID=502025 RepID=D0LQY1_HALO1|nr:ISKra4-like element ISHoc2 family transposase [Haliangium ochraceum]ACY15489.1 hypothetical protein Hoch_2978 [Haliangium ochraceum DSM 14365]